MTDNVFDFIRGIIKQLQDFVDENENPYYLIVTFENEKERIHKYSREWKYKEYCWCESDNKNGGCRTKYFHTEDEALKYGKELKNNKKVYDYVVTSEKFEPSYNYYVYWG